MRCLIRQFVFYATALLILPGVAATQVLQNSASGELNGQSLNVSQATVTLTRFAGVDAVNSTVTVNPPIVMADGVASSTVTVTLLDAANQPMPGRTVSLASSRGALDMLTQPSNPTDVNGVTTGEIRSVTPGNAQVLATDVLDTVLLNDQPNVLFTLGEVLLLTKTVSPERATVGDVVTYTIVIQNTVTSTVGDVRIIDEASPVLAYLPGTARLDGNVIADPLPGAADGV